MLTSFYQTPLGILTQRLLAARLAELWPHLAGEEILALGDIRPLWEVLTAQGGRLFGFTESKEIKRLARADPASVFSPPSLPLPVADASMDRVVALHFLENLSNPADALDEIGRVLKGEGRLLLIIPNRHGIWARSKATPFGSGQAYSFYQISTLLKDQGFQIDRARGALYVPPVRSRLVLSLTDGLEKGGRCLFPSLGGVLLIEARKRIYAPRPESTTARASIFSVPLPSSAIAQT